MSFGKELTIHHMFRSFDDPVKEALSETLGEKMKKEPEFPPFVTLFSTFFQTYFIIPVIFYVMSANAFSLNVSEILSFGKKLTF